MQKMQRPVPSQIQGYVHMLNRYLLAKKKKAIVNSLHDRTNQRIHLSIIKLSRKSELANLKGQVLGHEIGIVVQGRIDLLLLTSILGTDPRQGPHTRERGLSNPHLDGPSQSLLEATSYQCHSL